VKQSPNAQVYLDLVFTMYMRPVQTQTGRNSCWYIYNFYSCLHETGRKC